MRKTFSEQIDTLLELIPTDAYIGITDLAKRAHMDARIVKRVLETAMKLQKNKVRVKTIGKRTVYTKETRGRPNKDEMRVNP